MESTEANRGPALTQAPAVHADVPCACALPAQASAINMTAITVICRHNDDIFTPFTSTIPVLRAVSSGSTTPRRRNESVT
ncbi:MAG: hypothetical protein JHC82_08480 [Stenotrophomonas sp.]|nr:hypothetical protein [Stenotrophomonas sp.]